MISFAIWLVILLICFGVGAFVMRLLRSEADSIAEAIPFAIAIGLGVLAYAILGVGLVGALHAWVLILVLAALFAVGCRHIIALIQRLPAAFSTSRPRTAGAAALGVFILVIFLATLLGSLAPAADADYDSLVYHLAIPKVYLRDGSIHSIPWLTHSNFPFTLEMLYTLGLLLRDQSLSKLFHFGYGWLSALAIFAFGRRWWGVCAGWLGAAAFAAIPLVLWQMTTAYIELGVALYTFLTMYALVRFFEGRSSDAGRGWLWIAALMCGFALAVKMLAGAVFLFAIIALLWGLRSAPNRPRAAAAFILIAAAISAPWYIKSYLWTGNPVYPFFYDLFGGRYWSAERAREYAAAQKAFGLGATPLHFLLLPWNLTLDPQAFFDQPNLLRPFNVHIAVFGPLLLALLPTLIIVEPIGGPGRLLLWFGLTFVAIWFLLTQNLRYLVPILPGLCAVAGYTSSRLLSRRGLLSATALLALSVSFLSALYPAAFLSLPAARVALGLESRDEYLARVSQTYRIFEQVERSTPPTAKILILGAEPRSFYLDRDYLLGNHADIFTAEDLNDPDALLAKLKDMGITHLLIHRTTMDDIARRSGHLDPLLADLMEAKRLVSIRAIGPMALWQIADRESTAAQ